MKFCCKSGEKLQVGTLTVQVLRVAENNAYFKIKGNVLPVTANLHRGGHVSYANVSIFVRKVVEDKVTFIL